MELLVYSQQHLLHPRTRPRFHVYFDYPDHDTAPAPGAVTHLHRRGDGITGRSSDIVSDSSSAMCNRGHVLTAVLKCRK